MKENSNSGAFKAPQKNIKPKKKKGQIPERFDPDLTYGLSSEQVNIRLIQNKVNIGKKQHSKSIPKIIFSNIFTVFNLLCAICVVALAVVNAPILNYVFTLTYIFNITINIVQEIRAKKTIEKLSIMNQPTATVLRNGEFKSISTKGIVLDDIIKFTLGNQIAADCTVLEGEIEVNESVLTGESVPIKKQAGDTILAGSYVVSGTALAVADKVGDDRYIQILADKAKKAKMPSSELLRSLQWIIRTIGFLIVPIGLLVLYTNYNATLNENYSAFVSKGVVTPQGWTEIVTRTTSVIIGMIPAGMFLLTTLALAVGVIRLAQKKTSVQDMYALERLARVDVLCLDKTGTITDGRMRVTNCVIFDSEHKYAVDRIISSMMAVLNDNNQTALALRKYFGGKGDMIATASIPFSSERKYSAVSFSGEKGETDTYFIGAPEFLIDKNLLNKKVSDTIYRYTLMGQRVILLAHSSKELSEGTLPDGISPIALITLTDNIRKNAIKTIEWFKNNDVQVKVISGDNPITVSEVAKRAGIEGADKYVSLEGMADSEIASVANKYNVFGRVSPEQKAILVRALKSYGHTVAMTGDGVNDIIAMKESDCAVTVASGTDATKNVAHIVLMDNDFNSLPQVVYEGRRVINNIQRTSSLYLMKTLFIIIFAILAIVRGTRFALNNQMMILLETVVIGLGSLFLSMEKNTNKVEGKFISYVFTYAIPGAIVLTMNVLAFDIIGNIPWLALDIPVDYKDTLCVAALTFGGLVHLYVICKPFNLYRTILVLSLTTICTVITVFFMPIFKLPNFFHDITNNWPYLFIILCLIQFDVPVDKFFTMINEKIRGKKD